LRILACLSGLGLADEIEVQSFLQELAGLPPPSRYPFLDTFRYGLPRPVPRPYSALQAKFLEAVPPPKSSHSDYGQQALLWGYAAPVFGCYEESRSILMKAYGLTESQPHLQRQLRLALHGAAMLPLPAREAYLGRYEAAYGSRPELWGTALLEEAEYAFVENSSAASDLFQRAEPILAQCFAAHSDWATRRHEMRAWLAERAGQKREALAGLLTAQHAAVESGWPIKAARLDKEIEKYRNIATQTHHDADLLPPAATLHLDLRGAEVKATLPGGQSVSIPIRSPLSSSRSYAAELIDDLAYRRDEWFDRLRASLAPLASVPLNTYVELRTGRGAAASFPWEAVLPLTAGHSVYRRPLEPAPLRDTVLMLQDAMAHSRQNIVVDGIYGPQTDALLKNFGSDPREARRKVLENHPDRNPQILIVQSSVEHEQFQKRSHGNVGVDLLAEYTRRKLDAFRLSDSLQISTAIARFRPSLLHLVTSFQESTRTGEICLDLGNQEPVTASAVDGLLRRFSGGGLHPFVLVDAILPPDPYDLARQALMRNAFCDELFRFGNTRGVLAAGLAEPQLLMIAVDRMADAAFRRGFAADLHRDLAVLPMLLPPALFTLDPEIPVLW
jgi:hypothetical protein